MTPVQTPTAPTKAAGRPANAGKAVAALAAASRSTASKTTGRAPKGQAGAVLAQGPRMATTVRGLALTVTVDVDPLLDVIRRHVHLPSDLAKVIEGDFMRLFQNPALALPPTPDKRAPVARVNAVLSTQEAADLVGVSRPYIVARIEAGDIPLYQQVGNQRRVLKTAVLAWHRREQIRRRRALRQLGADLDDEIAAG
jgi:excisionase family DNA binding protein